MPTNEVPTTEQPRWMELADAFLGQQPVAGRDASWVRDFAAWVHNTHGPFTLFDHMQSLHEKDIRAQKALKRMADLGYEFNTETEQWVKTEVSSINTLYADHQRDYNERMRELMNRMMSSSDMRGLELRIDPMNTVTSLSQLAARHPLTTAGEIMRRDIDAPVRADIGTTGCISPRTYSIATPPPAPEPNRPITERTSEDRCYNALSQMRRAFRGLRPSRDALSDWLSYNRTLTSEERTRVLDSW